MIVVSHRLSAALELQRELGLFRTALHRILEPEDRIMRTASAFFAALFATAVLTGGAAAAEGAAAGGKNAPEKKQTIAEGQKKKNDKDTAHVVSTSPSYIGIDPIYTTILDGDAVVGTMMLGIGLDVQDPRLHDEVSHKMPELRDLYIRSMLYYTSVSIRPWRAPDVVDIAAKLQEATDKRMKRKGAVRVLLAQVAMRLNH